MSDLTARTVMMAGADGDQIEAYLARPEVGSPRGGVPRGGVPRGGVPRGGVVVIHHMPGYDRATREITRRFAEMGYDAICPNLYWREAPGAAPADAAALVRSQGGVPDERFLGDMAGAIAHLRALEGSNGKIGVIGHCSGGRHSVLAACNLDVQAAVDCYGAFVTGTLPEGFPLKITNLVDQLPALRCPLLGLFGSEDKFPSPEQVDELEAILTREAKEHEFHRYEGAGHAFFWVERPSYNSAAAADGWTRISEFYGRLLAD